MTQECRISGKNLGYVALPGYCPKCYWLKLKMKHRLPYQVFPGIFSSIDSYSKNIVHSWFDRHDSSPPWLASLGNIKAYVDPPHHSKFKILIRKLGITPTGSPDAIFLMEDGSYLIADYKTARFTKHQDALHPMYETQLNAYALIANEIGLNPVSSLVLIYTEPATDEQYSQMDEAHNATGFSMGFVASMREVNRPGNTGDCFS